MKTILDTNKLLAILGITYDQNLSSEFGGFSRNSETFAEIEKFRKDKIYFFKYEKNEYDEWRVIYLDENSNEIKKSKWGTPKAFCDKVMDFALFDKSWSKLLTIGNKKEVLEIIKNEIISTRVAVENYYDTNKTLIFQYWKELSFYENFYTSWIVPRIRAIIYQRCRGQKPVDELENLIKTTDRVIKLKSFLASLLSEIISVEDKKENKIVSTDTISILASKLTKGETLMSMTIRELLASVIAGELNVPTFQRDFVWKINNTAELFNSISMDFPIGNLLISGNLNFNSKNIFINLINKNEKSKKSFFLLDGQQRTTSILLLAAFDMIQEELNRRSSTQDIVFARKKIDEMDQLNFRYENKGGQKIIQCYKKTKKEFTKEFDEEPLTLAKNFNEITNVFFDYKIPVVLIERDKSNLIDIFQRINMGSVKLSTISLLNAAFFGIHNADWELLSQIANIKGIKGIKEFKLSDEIIVQSWKMITEFMVDRSIFEDKKFNINLSSIFDYFEMGNENFAYKFMDQANFVEFCLLKTIRVLSDYGFQNEKMLPSSLAYFASTLAFILKNLNNKEIRDEKLSLSEKQEQDIKKIMGNLAIRSLRKDYSSGTSNKVNEDIYNIFSNTQFKHVVEERDIEKGLKDSSYKNKNAFYKLFIAQLTLLNPKSLIDGTTNVLTKATIFEGIDNDQHHFAPKEWKNNPLNSDEKNNVKNIVLISAEENRKIIRNSSPVEYLLSGNRELGAMQKKELEESHLFDAGDFDKIVGGSISILDILEKRFKKIKAEFIKHWGLDYFIIES